MKNALILLAALLALLPACTALDGAEETDQHNVQEQQHVYQIAQPVPRFDFSLERAVAIQLYEARNQEVATHTVWRSDTGMIEGHCPSVGYPLPYDTSLTNPLQISWHHQSGAGVTEQAEPNGLYASHNSTATWVRCTVVVSGRRHVAPVYIESRVTAYPYPIQVEGDTVSPLGSHVPTVSLTNTARD